MRLATLTDLDAAILRFSLVEHPMPACRDELGAIGDLIDSGEADTEGAGCFETGPFIAAPDNAEAVEVAHVAAVRFRLPWTLANLFNRTAVGKYAVVFDDESIFSDVERHPPGALRVIRVLYQLVRQSRETTQISKGGAEYAKILNPTRYESGLSRSAWVTYRVEFDGHVVVRCSEITVPQQ